jgi:hypothetical protein
VRARGLTAAAEINEIKLAQLRGQLAPVVDFQLFWSQRVVEIRNAFLGFPSWLKQNFPLFTLEGMRLVDRHVRDILIGLANREGEPGSDKDNGTPRCEDSNITDSSGSARALQDDQDGVGKRA